MLRIDLLRAAAGVLMLALAWWVVHTIRHPTLGYFDVQYPTVEARADLVPKGGVLVIGDSITAQIYLPKLCGKPALNAGIAWATSHDWAPHASELVRKAQPSIVILALGENDDFGDWEEDYRKLAMLADFAVTPRQPDRAAFIRSLLPSVPVPGQTLDGVHLNPDGRKEWVRRVEAKCSRANDGISS